MPLKEIIKRFSPDIFKRGLNKLGLYDNYSPSIGKIKFGDFNRTKPFSSVFGYDRGGPIDRFYIENFLKEKSSFIKGNVLEIGDNEYTIAFGGSNVTKSDILHFDPTNSNATIIADLTNASHIPDNKFDCIILTQTLQFIYDCKAALETCYRILKPGGALLLTVPGISSIEGDEWRKLWQWSFTDNSVKKLLAEHFHEANINVDFYGNSTVAASFLFGVGLPEIDKTKLHVADPHFQVIITAIATK